VTSWVCEQLAQNVTQPIFDKIKTGFVSQLLLLLPTLPN
jgi:hypothetical protein